MVPILILEAYGACENVKSGIEPAADKKMHTDIFKVFSPCLFFKDCSQFHMYCLKDIFSLCRSNAEMLLLLLQPIWMN